MKPEEGFAALAQRILTVAGFRIGGEALAEHLGVPDETLVRWIEGRSIPPVEILLKALDLLGPASRRE